MNLSRVAVASICLAVAGVSLTACSSLTAGTDIITPTTLTEKYRENAQEIRTQGVCDQITSTLMSEAQAMATGSANNVTVYIANRDGMNYAPVSGEDVERISLTIANGVVTGCVVG